MEQEQNGHLPAILDALIVRKADGSWQLLVYHMKTHTYHYLNLSSHHPQRIQSGGSIHAINLLT